MRSGVLFSAALGYATIEDGYRRMYGEGAARVHPLLVPRAMPSAPASQVCMDLKIQGPSFNIASACASATHAIGTAFQMIRSGMLDVAIAGGCEAPLTLGFMRSWDALRVVAKDTCRPFSRESQRSCDGRRRWRPWCWKTWIGPGRAAPDPWRACRIRDEFRRRAISLPPIRMAPLAP